MGGVAYGTGRQALLESAVAIVASQGLRGLTFRNVAARAGVTQGLVRHHFGAWDSLVEEALLYSLARSVDESGLESDGPGFEGFAGRLVASVAENVELQAFQFELALEARRRPELAPVVARVYDSYRSAVARELRRNGIEDPDLAWAIFAAIDGLVFQQAVFGSVDATTRALNSLRTLLREHALRGA